MPTGYNRTDTTNNIATGNIINASDLDAEYDAIDAAFDETTGHDHGGASGNGAPITKVGPVQDVVVSTTSVTPKTTNTLDLGTPLLKFKDLNLAGNALIAGTLGITGNTTFAGAIISDNTTDSTSTTTGAIQTDGGLGVAKALWVGGLANIAGAVTLGSTLGVTGIATFTAQPILSSLTASRAVFTDGSKGLVSNAITGTGNVVMSASPTLTGTVAGASLSLSSLTSGRVAYATTAGLLTDSANLTFNGTTLTAGGLTTTGATSTGTFSATGVATFSAGTVSAPAITTTGDTNTGIFFPAADTIAFTEGGVESMRIDSSGNVGIGTTSPNGRFDVKVGTYSRLYVSSATYDGVVVGQRLADDGAATLTFIAGGATNPKIEASGTTLAFFTGASQRAIIDTSGNVGIGTASPVSVGGYGALTLNGTTGSLLYLQTNASSAMQIATNASGASITAIGASLPLYFSTNSTERMRIDSSGNVGIGTTSPAFKLEVVGGTNNGIHLKDAATATVFGGLFTQAANLALVTRSNHGLVFGTNDTTRMTIDNTGNVGVGTTTITSYAGSLTNRTLQINSSASTVSELRLTNTSASSGTSGGLIQQAGVDMYVWNGSAGFTAFGTSAAERMRIDSSGNVGIGTSSPAYKLSVNGTGNFYNGVAGLGRIFFGDPADPNGYIGIYRSALGPANWNTAGNGLNFASFDGYTFSTGVAVFGSQTERMRITSGGNLLVGTTVDIQKVSMQRNTSIGWVNAAGNSSDQIIYCDGSSNMGFYTNASERMRIDGSGVSHFGGISTFSDSSIIAYANGRGWAAKFHRPNNGNLLEFLNNTSTAGAITVSGSTAAYNTSSDYRLKENIAPMTGALAKVSVLKPVTYTWKSDGSTGQGFIAHELAEVVPDCVTGKKDAVDEEGNPVYQGIDTSFLVATLTKAIQEQQTLIENLTTRLNALEGK